MKPIDASDPRHRYAGLETLPVRITVRVGRTHLSVDRLASLEVGTIVPLDRSVSDPFDLLVGELLLCHVRPEPGEVGVALKLVAVPEDDDAPR